MKFDTIIIGGGLSGLICGIRLLQNNNKCLVISTGQSALHFSSGSFDLCSTTNGDVVTNILSKVSKLVAERPEHPYAKMGVAVVEKLMLDAKAILSEAGIETCGNGDDNHYRITPMGKLVPTWLTQKGYAVSDTASKLPWDNVTLFGIEGYLDSFPLFVADEFKALGVNAKVETFNLPILDVLRSTPTGLIGTSIARELGKEEHRNQLVKILKEKGKESDVLALPACVALECAQIVELLENETGKKIILIPTLPPSVAGSVMQKRLTNYFKKLGGVYMLGDTVEKADMLGSTIDKVYSYNHTDIPFVGENYVLASGGFFSKGLVSNNNEVKEPLFNLDVDFASDRFSWYNREIFDTQDYQSFGVKFTSDFQGLKDGKAIDNLYVAGALLSGYNPIQEGTGGGVSILSALFVADQILKKERSL